MQSIQVLGAHTYNPSYSRGRDQEDHSLKPSRANSSQELISKKLITKIGWDWLKVKALSSNPSTARKKTKINLMSFNKYRSIANKQHVNQIMVHFSYHPNFPCTSSTEFLPSATIVLVFLNIDWIHLFLIFIKCNHTVCSILCVPSLV
jgi:hypothetical protein